MTTLIMSTLMSVGKKQIILGIDPGLADTGYGLITKEKNQLKLIAYGSIKTKRLISIANRLVEIQKDLETIIKKYQPTAAAVEELFFYNNVKTAFAVGQARGVILMTLFSHGLEPREFTPLAVKRAVTGYGQADKKQIQQMVKIILNLKNIPRPDDAADALAVAICAANTHQY